jgi:hypothetical protein
MAEQPGGKTPPEGQGMPQHGPAQPAGREDYQERSAPRHTPEGAPTDAAHQDAGDGALTGSVPAGLTTDELRDQASGSGRDDAATD